jgi:2-iminoacetate synthase
MSFNEALKEVDWDALASEIRERTAQDVERSLMRSGQRLDDLASLLSPAAEAYLESMAQAAHSLTLQRFGKIISLFAPLYLSNECTNPCVYCGFNVHNPVERLTLSVDEADREARHLRQLGFRHVLLVSGEAPQVVTLDYLSDVLQRLRPSFSSVSIELYPMATDAYVRLAAEGVDGLVVYQETYNQARYHRFHPGGKKREFRWRLETPERGGQAGFRRIGIGALLGLDDWRTEAYCLGLHARYLLRHYWKSHITISFPRLRPAAGGFQPPHHVSDQDLVHMLTALRLFLPDVGFSLSTRETETLRDHLIPLGITSMSAGSRTEPGGYTHAGEAGAQFSVADERSPEVVAGVIRRKGYEPVWKDWDAAFLH